MDAEYLALDNGSDTKVIEDFCAIFPRVCVAILSDRLVVETVDGGDLASLVIASQESDVRRVLHLEAEEELEGLDRVEATIDEVAHENVAGVRDFTAFVEQLEKIVELAVNVSANCDRSLDRLNVAFLNEDFLDFLAEDTELALRQDGALLHSLKPVVDVVLTHFAFKNLSF